MGYTNLPRVTIAFSNGALGTVVPSADGCMGVITSGVAVAGSPGIALKEAAYIDNFAELATKYGITGTGGDALNAPIVKFMTEFYNHAPNGTRVWFMLCVNTDIMATMVANGTTEDYAHKLRKAANGEIRGLFICKKPASVSTVANGFDPDVVAAYTAAQPMAADGSMTPPIFCIIEGRDYNPAVGTVPDLTALALNRVGVMVGDTVSTATGTVLNGAAMGILAGKLASSPVHRNIGRVKDGGIASATAYIKNLSVEAADYLSLYQKGYITFRSIVGKGGFFFCDDPLATSVTDDYAHITARRTIDKVYRIAYGVMIEKLLDEIYVNEDGTMQASVIKAWQGDVENAIALSMTANGELSADIAKPSDRGVRCFIDPAQNVVSTSKVIVQVRVRPFGYARWIDVNLGFQTVTT